MSKINLSQSLLTPTGESFVENEKTVSIKDIIVSVLNVVSEGQTPEESYKCGELIVKISRSKTPSEIELNSEDITLIKSKVKKHGLPLTIIQICEVLEGNKNPFEDNEI